MNLRNKLSTTLTTVIFALTAVCLTAPAFATFSHESGFSPAYHGSRDNQQPDWSNLGNNWGNDSHKEKRDREHNWNNNNDNHNWGRPGGSGKGGNCWGNNGNSICTVSPC